MAELGNGEFSSRRERKLAESKSLSQSARSAVASVRDRGAELVATSTSVVRSSIPAAPSVSAPSRKTLGRAVVMTVALAIVGTFAIPAYAYHPNEVSVSVDEVRANLLDDAQTVAVDASAASQTVARDNYSTTAAPIVVARAANAANAAGGGGLWGSVDVSNIASNSAVLSGALALVGTPGDCTAFVETILRNMGYQVGDLAPMQFGSYGATFTDPSQVQPGDIMMRGGHVAIYAGDGLAAHGGLSWGTSGITPSAPTSYAVFVRVGG